MAQMDGYQKVAEKTFFNGEKLYEFKLKNGLRVLMVPRHQAKVLTYQTWFDVGSVHEKLDPKLKKTGLAHLFEHMMFRGTEKYPDGRFDELTARMGGEKQNATTHFYRTNYFVSIPSDQLEPLMALEADRTRALKLTGDVFEKEKGAVVGERRLHNDSPMAIAGDELLMSLFDVAPFRWTILGTEEEIKGFTLEEAQYFYKTFYAPNNATIIVVGDISEDVLMKLLVKYYGDMPSQEVPRTVLPAEPEKTKERRVEKGHKQATSELLLIGYPIGDINSPDAVPLSLLGAHLSTGMEARLRKLLVDPGIAVSAAAHPNSKPNIFEFFIQLAEKRRADQALVIVDREISLLQRKKVSEPEFRRALNQELLSLYADFNENSSLGNWLGEYLMLAGNYMRGFEIVEGYKAITPADLQAVAKKYFKKQNRSMVIVGPEKMKGKKS